MFDGFARGLHRGHGRRDRREAEQHAAAAREGDATTVASVEPKQHFTEPPPRYTEAKPDQGARGARHRSAVDVCRDDLDDRRPRLRDVKSGACIPSRSARSSRTCSSTTSATGGPRVHGAHGGGPRRGRQRRRVPGGRVVRDFYVPFRDLVDSKRKELRRVGLHDRGQRRGVLAGPPDGHPAGPERAIPGLLAVSGAQGVAPAAGRGARGTGAAMAGRRARRAPMRRAGGTLVQKRGRFGLRRLLPLSRVQLHPQGGSSAPEPLPFEVACPTCQEGHLVARRARRTGSVFWGCSRYPKCDFTTSREPVGRGP